MTDTVEKEFYFTIDKEASAEFRERGSRFIAFAFPVSSKEEFKKYLQQVKKHYSAYVFDVCLLWGVRREPGARERHLSLVQNIFGQKPELLFCRENYAYFYRAS